MSEVEIPRCFTTYEIAPKPLGMGTLQHFTASDDNLPVAASDWRAEAEARGRAAYEAAAAEPQTTEEPLAWLWGSGVQGAKTQ